MGDAQQPVPYRRIGAILAERGIITDTQLGDALEEQRRSGRLLGEILVNSYRVTRVDLADALAEQWAEAQKHARQDTERRAKTTVSRDDSTSRPLNDVTEDELRILLEEAKAARAELAHKTDELGKRLAALEALVVGVSGALNELRGDSHGESAVEPAPTPGSRQPRPRSGRRSTVSR